MKQSESVDDFKDIIENWSTEEFVYLDISTMVQFIKSNQNKSVLSILDTFNRLEMQQLLTCLISGKQFNKYFVYRNNISIGDNILSIVNKTYNKMKNLESNNQTKKILEQV